ncbi:MAG: gamma-glutamyltransferase [bacterium]|nr:gamma-glutamyltransferase [bacterium]
MTCLASGCAQAPKSTHRWIATGTQAMVASDSIYASQAGLEILRAGGNAFDAAATVSFALAVTRPQSTGLGGGGFMMARSADDGRIIVHDFRETAPASATEDMFVKAVQRDPDGPRPSRNGHLAVAVPGLLAGRVAMLEAYGTRSLAEVLAPAIRLARDGFAVDQAYVTACGEALKNYVVHPRLIETCGYVYRVHLREGDLRRPGDVLAQPALARLLTGIAAHGADFFYRGPVAAAIEQEMQAHGGVMRAADLAAYRPVTNRRPIVTTYRDYTVIGMPPCSSGGICLAQTLNILEQFDLPEIHCRDPALATHLMLESMKHAFADRARWLGDADVVSVPVDLLTSKTYAQLLAQAIDPDRSADVATYGADVIPDDAGTSHFCIVDRWGNCVVSTETINTSFGSLAAVDEWGLILNNEMDDFAAEPGRANVYGLIQSTRNAVAPGKRPLSSMTPTIVLRDGQPCLLLGGSGGPRIISSVLLVLLAVTDLGMSLDEAMTDLRPHHQWRPDEVFFDAAPPEALAASLTERGHRVSSRRRTGVVQAVRLEGRRLIGAADPRKGGAPAGY